MKNYSDNNNNKSMYNNIHVLYTCTCVFLVIVSFDRKYYSYSITTVV